MLLAALVPILTTLISRSHAAPPDCTGTPQLSCHNTTAVSSCCMLSPGGQLLQAQFWDASPSEGPTDSWTIHGLWPDNCDGSFLESCDKARVYTNISAILKAAGESSLVDYMQTYWISNDESDEKFWENEWSEHGTCVSTLDPSCYADYQPQEEVVDYFNRVVALFKSLDTYQFLSDAGITPSSSQTYQLGDIQAALDQAHGGKSVLLGCENGNTLSRASYPYEVRGSFQTGTFEAADYVGDPTNCPSEVSYPPKGSGEDAGSQVNMPNFEDMDYRDEL